MGGDGGYHNSGCNLNLLVPEGHMQNFITLGQLLLGDTFTRLEGGGGERERKNTINSGHYVLLQCSRAAHTLRSDQFLLMSLLSASLHT